MNELIAYDVTCLGWLISEHRDCAMCVAVV